MRFNRLRSRSIHFPFRIDAALIAVLDETAPCNIFTYFQYTLIDVLFTVSGVFFHICVILGSPQWTETTLYVIYRARCTY